MSRTLVVTTIAGLAICGLSLGAAALVGGDDIFHDPRSLEGVKPLIDLATHKAWRWNGGDTLALDAPINIRYQQEGAPQVSITGPAEAIEHVRVSKGRIAADNSLSRKSGRKVEAVVSGIPIRKFVVNGGEHLDLGDVKQPDLDLHINGTGTVSGSGEVGQLNLVIAGPGKADLGALSVRDDAKVAILGNGIASLAPKGDLRLFVAGNGRLAMTSKPRNIRQTILGSGDISQMSQEAARQAVGAMDVGRIASDAADQAVQAALGSGRVSEIAAEAARKGIESAEIDRHVREGVERGLAGMDQDVITRGDTVTVLRNHNIDLGHIEQPRLKVSVLASGSAAAEGKVDELSIEVMGSGQANFGRLAARRAKVTIAGSGDVTVAPGEELKVTIMGSGNVRLTTKPARIEQQIMGSGRIIPAN